MEIKTHKDEVATVYEYWSEEDYKKPVPCPTTGMSHRKNLPTKQKKTY